MSDRSSGGPIRRVLFVSHSAGFEGAEQSLLDVVRGLDRRRFAPVVVLPSRQGELHRRFREADVPVVVLPTPSWVSVAPQRRRWWRAELDAIEAMSNLIDVHAIDVVYTNSVDKLSGAIAAALRGRPHVWHVREILEGHTLQSLFPLPVTFAAIAGLSNRVIAISEAVARQFSRGAGRRRVRIVLNGIDAATFNQRSESREPFQRDFPVGVPIVGVIGKLSPPKNQILAVRAFEIIARASPTALLVFAGREMPGYRHDLDALIRSRGLEDRVRFLGFRTDVRPLFSEIDVLLIPSVAEPFGRVAIEAMAASKPVVATDAGAMPEIIEPGVTGHLVPPGDPERMAAAALSLLENRDQARRMGEAGRRRVETRFRVQTTVENVARVIDEVSVEGVGRLRCLAVRFAAKSSFAIRAAVRTVRAGPAIR